MVEDATLVFNSSSDDGRPYQSCAATLVAAHIYVTGSRSMSLSYSFDEWFELDFQGIWEAGEAWQFSNSERYSIYFFPGAFLSSHWWWIGACVAPALLPGDRDLSKSITTTTLMSMQP